MVAGGSGVWWWVVVLGGGGGGGSGWLRVLVVGGLKIKKVFKSTTVYVHDLSPEISMKLIRNSQDKEFQGNNFLFFLL